MTNSRQPPCWALSAFGGGLALAIFLIDLKLPLGIAWGVPYMGVVLLGWWLPSRRQVFALAAACSVLVAAGYFLSPDPDEIHRIAVANRILAIVAIWILAALIMMTKSVMRTLRESESLFRSIIDNSPSFIAIKDADGRFRLINKKHEKMLGVELADIKGKRSTDVHPAKTAAEAVAQDRKVIETKSVVTVEREIPSEGENRAFIITKFPMLDDAGGVKGIGIIGTDISDLKRMEQRLSETRRQLQGIVDHIPGTVFRRALKKDGTEVIEYIQGQLLSELGIDNEDDDYRRQLPSRLTIAEDRGIREKAIRDSAATMGPCDYRIRIRKKDGEIKWMRSISTPHRRDNGDVVWDGIVLDVTESMRAEAALRESEERYRAIVETQTEMVRKCRPDGVRTFVNDAYCHNYDIAREEFIGTKIGSHVVDEDRPAWDAHFRSINADNRTASVEIRVRNAKGEIRWHHWIDTGIFDRHGRLVEVLGIGRDITDRKRAENALKESERRFRDYVEAAHETIWEMDENLRFTSSSHPGARDMTTRPELVGKTRWELAGGDPDSDENWRRHRADLEARRAFRDFYHAMMHKDGRVHHWRVSGKPVFDENGAFKGYRGTASDVTARVNAESALKESEDRLRAIVDNMPALVSLKTPDGRYLLLNKEYSRRFDIDPLADDDKSAAQCFSKEVAADFALHDAEVVARKAPVVREHRIPLADGVHTHLCAKFPILDSSGNVSAVGTVSTDITYRKRAEEALKKSENRLAEILDIAPEAVITVGRDMNIQLFNKGAERTFGYVAKEVIGRPVDILLPEKFRHHHRAQVEAFGRSEDTYRLMGYRPEIRGVKKDGTEFPAAASVSKLEIGDEMIYTVLLRDLSEQKRVEEQLIELQGSLSHLGRLGTMGEMAAELAHELNQPLAAITNYSRGALRRLRAGSGDSVDMPQIMELIADQALRAGEIIRELRGFMRRAAPKKTRVNLKRMIDEVLALFAGKIREGNVELDVWVPKSLPPVTVDLVQIQQVLVNLVGNALAAFEDAATANRRLEIGVVAGDGGEVEIYVQDNGPGISPDALTSIFNPFFTTKPDGMGMGLSISRSIVASHDGRLWATSRPGEGACFHVALPAG